MAYNLEQYYDTGADQATTTYGTWWSSQTFTTVGAFNLSRVSALLYRHGTPVGNVTVNIFNTTAGKPSGESLGSSSVVAATLTTDTDGLWYNFDFSSPVALNAATQYAIVITVPSGNSSNYVKWLNDYTSATYADGDMVTSLDGGATWSIKAGKDYMFRTYSSTGVFYVDMAATGGGTGGGSATLIADVVIDMVATGGGAGGGSAALLSHVKLNGLDLTNQIVVTGNDQLWYEDAMAAGTMVELEAARDDIDTSDQLVLFELMEKIFVVNGANLKVADFSNTKITTTDVGANPPDRGNILTGGTSAAQMIVDFITADSGACTIYGKRTTDETFENGETVTGTDDDSNAISFVLNAAEVAPPHWYDWTPYANDTATYGTLPDKAYLGCVYRGRAVLSGDPDYPFQWRASREGNPFDFDLTATDAQRATAGGTGELGQLGDVIRALIPWKDDALAFGCANSFVVLRGNPADGGYMDTVGNGIGVFGQTAWCFDESGQLYFWGPGGVYRATPGFGSIQNLTVKSYPDLVEDEDANPATHRIVFGYDPRQDGVQISVTKLADGSNSCYWLDKRTGGLYPDEFNSLHGAYSMMFYDANDPAYKHLLIGCTDGYIRRFDPTATSDDGVAIDSFIDYGPIQMTSDPQIEGVLYSVEAELGGGGASGTETDSNDLTWRVWVDRAADAICEKLDANTTPNIGGTFKAPGRCRGAAVKRKVKGVYAGFKLRNNTLDEAWAFEKLIVGVRPAGRAK